LYFEDLAKLVAPEYYKSTNPVYYVKEGIRKIESMQLYDGSMVYWQGGTYTNWWGSVYAAHFLLEAKKGGYDVSENVLKKLLKYISKKAKDRSTFDYITRSQTGRTVHKIANKEILYSLYVLALAGEGDIATMNYYKARPHLVSADMRYMLAGSYALMGRWNSYYEVVPSSYEPVHPVRLTGGSFDSDIVNEKVKEEDSYLQIRRTYYSYKTGRKIFDNKFYQGELIVCKIELTGFGRGADNIIISDLIPAGFEIENPRLNPATELTWVPKNPLRVDYMDIRDDRLLLFTKLNSNKINDFYYLLRVVNQGTYQLPVIGAEAMYDQEYHSYHGAGVIKILERWVE
jgi:uncharacterized protein YfaS (alpha-2-macroglobulin family)